jgi:hypothetical protein
MIAGDGPIVVAPMVLIQRNSRNGPIQTLPEGQDDVDTGLMGGCNYRVGRDGQWLGIG